jgi:hypothetical protein
LMKKLSRNVSPALRLASCLWLGCWLTSSAPAVAAGPGETAASRLELLPPALSMSGPRDSRRPLAIEVAPGAAPAGGGRIDRSLEARYELEPGSGLSVDEDGYLVPLRDGRFTVTVKAGGLSAELPVQVEGMASSPPVSYLREVQPILSKVGCTAGPCHGGAKGRKGFKLSLRGYDPEWDYRALTEDLAGRRVNRVEPASSLMLSKPTEGVAHEGGLVIEEGSRYYRTIVQWITEGARSDLAATRRVERLEVLPPDVLLADAGGSQQFLVIAHYPDKTTRDVTRDAIFTVNNTVVAEVTPGGRVSALRRGEAAVLVRYEGAYGLSTVTILGQRPGFQWRDAPEYNFIDGLVAKKLRRLLILPSEVCTDAEFIRRVSLDLIGIPPTPEEVRTFLGEAVNSPGAASRARRERLVDRLLERPEFVDHWSLKWGDLLRCNRKFLGEKGVWTFRNWIRQEVAQNRPFDRFAKELLTSTGSVFESPAASFYRSVREPNEVMETTTQLFLGVRMMCCKCHDHPFEQWTQGDYYHLSAYFAKVGRKPGARKDEEVIYEGGDGEVRHPKDGRVMNPGFPFTYTSKKSGPQSPGRAELASGRAELASSGAELASRRAELAEWVTSPENPYFARAIANRLWSYFLGRGIIDPVDDIRASNPPNNPELLDALADDLTRHGFDLQRFMKTVVSSRTYQLSMETNPFNADDLENFSHAIPRRLNAEQLRDAISVASGTPPRFPGVPADYRAEQLPDGQIAAGGFLDLFGRPPRESVCECERRSEVSLSQALNMVNGSTVAEAVQSPEGRVARLVPAIQDDGKLVEELYLAGLSRPPTAEETKMAVEALHGAASRKEGAEDLLWALLNSPAFLFNR